MFEKLYKVQDKLNELIEKHELWIDTNGKDGKQLILIYDDLSDLDLSNRNLTEAEFCFCNLKNVNFSGSNLTGVSFIVCDNLETIITNENTLPNKMACQESGEFVGYKKCFLYDKNKYDSDFCIVKLLIPADAKRSSATRNKCRYDKAYVLGFYDFGGDEIKLDKDKKVFSLWNNNFEYKLNECLYPDYFDKFRWDECSNGIHFFMTFNEAVDFYWGMMYNPCINLHKKK